MWFEWFFCGAHYPNFVIHHFVTIKNHKYLNHMLELYEEASIDCIWGAVHFYWVNQVSNRIWLRIN